MSSQVQPPQPAGASVVPAAAAKAPRIAPVLAARERSRLFWDRWVTSVPWVAFALSLLTLVLAGITVNLLTGSVLLAGLVPGPETHRGWSLAGVAAAFALSAYALFHKRADFQAVRTLSQRPARPHQGLVLLLSPPSLPLEDDGPGFRVGGVALTGTDLDADVEALSAVRWSWQQLLRALRPHRDSLRHVYLIGSGGHRGSFAHLPDAERLVRAYLPGAAVHRVACAVDFEHLGELQECVAAAVSLLLEKGLRKEEVMIDVTGGQKTASIAGAVITLNSNVTFQYVQTNPPFEALEYDLEIRSSGQV